MLMDRMLFMIIMIYLSFCIGTYLKFREYGIKKNSVVLSCLIPAGLIVFCIYAPIRFLLNKKKYPLGIRVIIFPFLIYKTVKSFPALVGFTANSLVEIRKKSPQVRQVPINKENVTSFNRVFWPKVERYYDATTTLRFGRA